MYGLRMDWQPIETAPKDGTRIFAFGLAYAELAENGRWFTADTDRPREPHMMVIQWKEFWYDREIDNGDGTYRKEPHLSSAYWSPEPGAFRPTHWMPLPPDPTSGDHPSQRLDGAQ